MSLPEDEPEKHDEPTDSVDAAEQGAWWPLNDAVRELGVTEKLLYQLVSRKALRAREPVDGDIEIWVAAEDALVDEPPAQALEVIPEEAPLAQRRHASDDEFLRIDALIAPLAKSYEQNVRLARENGELSERLIFLERELNVLQESTASDKQALAQARKRVEALEGANVSLTGMLSARAEEGRARQHRESWLPLVLVLVVLSVALVGGWLWFVARSG